MKGVIPTGGRGTRMQPLTFSINKHFIPVANKPLIFYPIEAVSAAGIKDIAIVYNPGWLEAVKNVLGDGSKWGAKFTYVLQEKPLGLANIFQVCEEFLSGESFLMHLGDNIFVDGIKGCVDYFEKERPDGLITMVHHPDNRRLGVPYFKKGRLLKYVEKPKNPPHDFGIPGLYFFDSNVFRCFKGNDRIKPSERGELEIGFPYNWLIGHGFRVDVLEYKGKWLDPGKFDDWLVANQFLLDVNAKEKVESKLGKNNVIENRVTIGKGCKIDNSKIRGPVAIGDSVVVKNSYIGPYSSISNGCLLENARIENSVLMEGVKISSVAKTIEDSVLGSYSEVSGNGAGTSTLNLFIGEKAQVKL